jgi:O-antigen ligase
MSDALRPARAPHRWTTLLDRVGAAILVLGAGVVLGQQYVSPNKRVIPVIAAILLAGLAWRVDMATAIGVLVLALPFPRPTVFGNTNLAFVLLLLIIWLLRITLKQSAMPRSSPMHAPLVALFVCYVVSFYNVEPANVGASLMKFGLMVGCWLMFVVVASNVRTQRDFERVLVFHAVSVFLVCLVAVWELTHPGANVSEFLYTPLKSFEADASLTNIRVGSVFSDFELLCEYCALNALLVLFLFLRSRSLLTRLAHGGLLVFVVFVLFTTVTRGGLIALAVGAVYLMWALRRRLTFVGVTVSLALVVVGAVAMNAYVASSTQSGDLFERLFASEIQGLIPDSRAKVWPEAWARIFQHPLIGHGPLYTVLSGARIFHWPHSLPLFIANNIGFIGLAVFAWLLWTLFRLTRPVTDDLRNGDYVESYLIVARTQMVVFLVDEIKIEYLRNEVYQFQVWLLFALMVAAHQIARARRAHGPAGGRAAAAAAA